MNLKKIFAAMLVIGIGFNFDLFAPRADGARRPARVPEADTRQIGRPVEEPEEDIVLRSSTIREPEKERIGFSAFFKIILEGTLAKVPFRDREPLRLLFRDWFSHSDKITRVIDDGEKYMFFIKFNQIGGEQRIIYPTEYINIALVEGDQRDTRRRRMYLIFAYNEINGQIRTIGQLIDFTKTADRGRFSFEVMIKLVNGDFENILLQPVEFSC